MRKGSRKLYNDAIQRGIPILIGIVRGNQIIVWCPFCRLFHFHGANGPTHLRTRGSVINWDLDNKKELPNNGEGFRTMWWF